jgi:outer membrane lipoprotein-sorting protein
MKKIFTLLLAVILYSITQAQTPNAKKLIAQINQKFQTVSDYSSDVQINFDIPSVKMSNIKAKVYYKKPNKFRIKAPGVLFLPKQNPMQQIQTMLNDTSAYTAIISGQEKVGSANCYIVNIIPIKPMNDLVLGKFWVDVNKVLILKSEVTTKNNGTLITLNTFGAQSNKALPDKMEIVMDVNKFKIPKMMALDINKKKAKGADKPNERETARIIITFLNYKINTNFDNAVFSETSQ